MISLSTKIFDFLASIKLAIILLLLFAAILGWATFYESSAGTDQAQEYIYKTWWFDLYLFFLGVNVIFSAVSRFPWKKRHTGFVITHIGIVIILLGSVVTRKFGIEGQLILSEGESSNEILVDHTVLAVSIPRLNVRQTFDPWFLDKPLPPGKEIRYPVGDTGVVCYVDRYFSNPQSVLRVTGGGPAGQYGAHISIFQEGAAQAALEEWLLADHASMGTLNLMSAKVTFHKAASAEDLQNRLAPPAPGQAANQIDLIVDDQGILHYRAMNANVQCATGEVEKGGSFATTWSDFKMRIDDWLPGAKAVQEIVDGGMNGSGQHNNPLIHVRLENKGEAAQKYVSFDAPETLAAGGEICTVEFGRERFPMGFSIQLVDFEAPRYPGTNRPASFQSKVKLIDAPNRIDREQLIYMNNPLGYNQFLVYQSSYIEGQNGEADVSVFSVARAPGTPIIYFGSIVLILGMILIFGSKTYGARKAVVFQD
ncbi:MAG: cytochrome c biogenesis protein ResB [Candidatus Omnitrophota bacterium]